MIEWTPAEAQRPSSNLVILVVSDSGLPSLTATQTFAVVVLESNLPPSLAAIGNPSVTEGAELAFTATATEVDLPAQTLTFSLSNAPAGAVISSDGQFSWTPTEVQGPGTYAFTVVVNDGVTNTWETIQVEVLEANAAPVLAVITNQTLFAGETLLVTNIVADADLPANVLTFRLFSSPTGMVINAQSGVIEWSPTEGQGPSSNLVTVVVSDNGQPSLSTTQAFAVVVLAKPIPIIITPLLSREGVFSFGFNGQPGKVYVMEASTNLGQTNWTIIATNTLGSNGVWQFSDPASTNLPKCYYRAKQLP